MRDFEGRGPYRDIVRARGPEGPSHTVELGLRTNSIALFRNDGRTVIAQYYGIVQDGVREASHMFRGLQRPMLDGEDTKADQRIVVYSWVPRYDYVWHGDRSFGRPVAVPMEGRGNVFVVLVKEQPDDEHGVYGTIERWNWVREDPILSRAPVNWHERFGQKLWSRS